MNKFLIIFSSLCTTLCFAAQPSSLMLAHKTQEAVTTLVNNKQTTAARRLQMVSKHLMPPAPQVISAKKGQPFGKYCMLSAVPDFKQFWCLPFTDVVLFNGCQISTEYLC